MSGPWPLPDKSLAHYDQRLKARCGVSFLIGVDEAGRGPLAGPVVCAAVILPTHPPSSLLGVDDSKKLSPKAREHFYPLIRAAASVAVSWAHPAEIDRDNILAATLAAMGRAARRVSRGAPGKTLVVVDGNRRIPGLGLSQTSVVDGDALSLTVACASVVAKVVRDRWMQRLDRRTPGYGLARHKGYGTEEHLRALRSLGPSRLHRMSFKPCA